jgi:hypothetical protein
MAAQPNTNISKKLLANMQTRQLINFQKRTIICIVLNNLLHYNIILLKVNNDFLVDDEIASLSLAMT